MIPLRIAAHLAGGVAYNPGEGLSIDGPLAWAAALERTGAAALDEIEHAELTRLCAEPDPAVPLAVHRAAGFWCYCASFAEVHGGQRTELVHWNKRWDDALAQQAMERGALDLSGRTRVDTGAGEFRSYHMPLYLEYAERLLWYVVGDRAEVTRLLAAHITHLGKKRAHGHGMVVEWEVLPAGSADRWLWRAPGELARPAPLAMLPDWTGATELRGYRPPYWLPQHQAECAV